MTKGLYSSSAGTVPASAIAGQQCLAFLSGANLNSTADQHLTVVALGANAVIRRIVAYTGAGTVTLVAGGVYTAASKGGTAVVAAGQSWSTVSSSVSLDLTVAAGVLTGPITLSNLYLSLTTAAGSAATCNIAVFGDVLP